MLDILHKTLELYSPNCIIMLLLLLIGNATQRGSAVCQQLLLSANQLRSSHHYSCLHTRMQNKHAQTITRRTMYTHTFFLFCYNNVPLHNNTEHTVENTHKMKTKNMYMYTRTGIKQGHYWGRCIYMYMYMYINTGGHGERELYTYMHAYI